MRQLFPAARLGRVLRREDHAPPVRRRADRPAEAVPQVDIGKPVAAAVVHHLPVRAAIRAVQQETVVARDPAPLPIEDDGAERALAGLLDLKNVGDAEPRNVLFLKLLLLD